MSVCCWGGRPWAWFFGLVLLGGNAMAAGPVLKPILSPLPYADTDTLSPGAPAGAWIYYQLSIAGPQPGLRVVLTHTGTGNPDLFIRRDDLPTTGVADKSSRNQLVDTLLYTDAELVPGHDYYIGVFLAGNEPGPATYTLSVEGYGITTLAWDDGTADHGTAVQPQPSLVGGKYYFKLTTQNTAVGAWRTALSVTSGEAHVHLKRAPFAENPNQYVFHSTLTGSDGFVLHSSQFAAAQDWFILIDAQPGSTWNLVSGEAYVQSLGALTDTGGSGSGAVSIGPEGMRFFKTTTTADTLAWCLWLNGGTNVLLVKKIAAPHPLSTATYDLKQAGQMLVVPAYLVGGDQYFVGVVGVPNTSINLDSRKIVPGDLAFNRATNFTVTGCPYRIFRVQVPVSQIAWDVKTLSLLGFTTNTSGNGDMWLAGMPNGSTASGTDRAPASSPALAAGLSLAPGIALGFSANGGVANDAASPISPPDGGAFTTHQAGAQNGISDVVAPINAAMGVFLGPDQPDLTPAPAALDFSPTGNVPGGVDYTAISPLLKQVFFIGNGETASGQKQRIVVPAGATRIYLGTMDGFEWTNNHGSLTIEVYTETNEHGLAVRRDFVPNEWNNDAFSEQAGQDDQGITLVPPALSDGTFFITVHGNAPFNCTLFNGDPLIRDVPYISKTANIDLRRIGWAYFVVTNVPAQLGSLGWDLVLSNAPPQTELAIRRNFMPGRWNYRNGSSTASTRGFVDLSSRAGFLQEPGHQADIWYIGVYNPSEHLGPFLLCLNELLAPPLSVDGSVTPAGSQPAGRWQYFRVDVPADVLGWDVRLIGGIAGQPKLVVRRGQLPDSFATQPWTAPQASSTWPSGNQWAANDDWTRLGFDATGSIDERNRILVSSMGRPLEPGTYYIGVNNTSGNPMVYTVQSRGIGGSHAIPVPTLLAGSPGNSITVNGLPAREAAYYHILSPAGDGWKVRLGADSGEVMLSVAKGVLPNIAPGPDANAPNTSGQRMQKPGNEHFVELPAAGTAGLTIADYYLAVISEGASPGANSIGTGTSGFTLTNSVLPVNVVGGGTVNFPGPDLLTSGTLEGGELAAYRFDVPAGVPSLEVRLENRQGDPHLTLRPVSVNLPHPQDGYGVDDGETSALSNDDELINVPNPPAGTYKLIVKANRDPTGSYPPASYTLRIRAIDVTPISFDGGTSSVAVQPADTWRFFRIDVPNDTNVLGWDIRLRTVTGGKPRLVVRRDLLPNSIVGGPWSTPQNSLTWPSGYAWAAGPDWTARSFSPGNITDERYRILAMGMGRPLEPGTYLVGVIGNGVDPAPLGYTVQSRGIGAGQSIPVAELSSSGPGNTATINNLAPREAAYFHAVTPPGPGWKVRVNAASGDSMLIVAQGVLPNVAPGSDANRAGTSGQRVQKTGNEHFVELPAPGTAGIPAASYYLAIVSEGMNPGNDSIGTNTSSFTVTNGALPLNPIGGGFLNFPGPDLTSAGSLEGGELAGYRFDVPAGISSLDVRLEGRVGNPHLTLRALSGNLPHPQDPYGVDDGETASVYNDDALITVPNPPAGSYRLIVKANAQPAGTYPAASYIVRVHANDYLPLNFYSDASVVTGQAAGTWRFFQVIVPANDPSVLGWDIRVSDVSSGKVRLVVRRDLLPTAVATGPWGTPQQSSTWPSGNQWAAGEDWTGRDLSPDGLVDERNRILAMGLGRPLQPGTYFVGVTGNGTDTNALSYTIQTRGIGNGLALPITDLSFAGGSAANAGITAREAAYYRVHISAGTASWKVKLTPTAGDALLVILKDLIPNVVPSPAIEATGANSPGQLMHKTGNEHFLLLPAESQGTIPAGDYFLAVVAEGGPITNANRIGAGSSSFTLTSEGLLHGNGQPFLFPGQCLSDSGAPEGGEVKAYQFVPGASMQAVQVSLDNVVGNPLIAVRMGNLPHPNASPAYGVAGGFTSERRVGGSLLTIPNVLPRTYSMTINAGAVAGNYPDASYSLHICDLPVTDLSFDASLNAGGIVHATAGSLADNQRRFYRVQVPAMLAGQPVVGWKLSAAETSGQALIRARPMLLPDDADAGNEMPFRSGEAVLVAPFLMPCTWLIEVKGVGSTAFTLVSSALRPEQTWRLPLASAPPQPPSSAAFGDTGAAGVDLEKAKFHYYAVVVPAGNGGLLRTRLDAISGNPNLYLRAGDPPTLSHGVNGPPSSPALYDSVLTGSGMSEQGNWVPVDGKSATQLAPGNWYLAVQAAGNANVRYRLQVSPGDIQDLPLNGSVVGQTLAGGDWRYYRFQLPLNSPPRTWNLTFAEILGDVVVHVRDDIPPGQAATVTNYRDWADDAKNHGPYPSFDAPGTYALNVPPLRPGRIYYVGVRAKNDATFTLSSSTNGAVPLNGIIPFSGGSLSSVAIPANGVLTYRIDVPANGAWWSHTSTHPAAVQVYLDQGSIPTRTSSDHFHSSGANSSVHRALNGTWPWLPGQSYFLTLTNTGAAANFSFNMNGLDTATDTDHDGLPDYWELTYFGNTSAQNAAGDPDRDGLSNAQELAVGGNPNDSRTPGSFSTVDFNAPPCGPSSIPFTGQPGLQYWLERNTTTGIGWLPLLRFKATGSRQILIDCDTNCYPARLYRTRL